MVLEPCRLRIGQLRANRHVREVLVCQILSESRLCGIYILQGIIQFLQEIPAIFRQGQVVVGLTYAS